MKKLNLIYLLLLVTMTSFQVKSPQETNKNSTIENKRKMTNITYKTIDINGVNIAYREAGNRNNPTIVLLHGFPSSSHQYRKVLHQYKNRKN